MVSKRPTTEAALRLCRIVRAAVCAAEQDPANLALLGMQQDGAAMAAGIIHRMFAGHEHGRSVQDHADWRRVNDFEADLRSGHDVLPDCRRDHYRTLSHRRL